MLSKVREQGARYPVIFVDYFDTLAFRRVHPFEVLKIWACQARALLGVRCPAGELHLIRMAALESVGAPGAFPPLSYTYDAWLRALKDRLDAASLLPPAMPFESFRDTALEIEERVELQCQYPNEDAFALLAEWKTAGKQLHIVSDFYMPRRSLLRALRAFGREELFDGVHVSSELGATKQDGSLYRALLRDLRLNPRDVFMFGDNRGSDVLQAQAAGITACQIHHEHNGLRRKVLRRLAGTGATRALFHSAFNERTRALRRSGAPFCEYVLAYYFFIERLHRRLAELGIRNAVFLAREGLLLQQFFQIWQERNTPPAARAATHYLRMSRQSAAILRLRPLDEETFPHITAASPRQFLDACGFTNGQADALAEELSGSLDTIEARFTRSAVFRRLLASNTFRRLYDENRAANAEAFRRYFAGFNFAPNETIAIVDVGWTGRMQDAVTELTGQPTHGLYLGLRTPASLASDRLKEGLIFSTIPRRSPFCNALDVNRQIYEQLLMAPHGGVVSYSLGEDGECIVNENYRRAERDAYQRAIAPVQQIMLAAFRELCDDPRLKAADDIWVTAAIARLGIHSGIFVNAVRRRFLKTISRGFVDNFAAVKVGIAYTPPKIADGNNDSAADASTDAVDAAGNFVVPAGTRRRAGPARRLVRLLQALARALLNTSSLSRYMVKVCTIENPLARRLLFCCVVLPWWLIGGHYDGDDRRHASYRSPLDRDL